MSQELLQIEGVYKAYDQNLVLRNINLTVGQHEVISLTMAIISINSWNRMSIAFRKPAGTYVSKRQPLVRAEAN